MIPPQYFTAWFGSQSRRLTDGHRIRTAIRSDFFNGASKSCGLAGAGKTTLLEATIRRLGLNHSIAIIEGNLQTNLDSQRIRALGVPSYQITTETVCHLDARICSCETAWPSWFLSANPITDVPARRGSGRVVGNTEVIVKPRSQQVLISRANLVDISEVGSGLHPAPMQLSRAIRTYPRAAKPFRSVRKLS